MWEMRKYGTSVWRSVPVKICGVNPVNCTFNPQFTWVPFMQIWILATVFSGMQTNLYIWYKLPVVFTELNKFHCICACEGKEKEWGWRSLKASQELKLVKLNKPYDKHWKLLKYSAPLAWRRHLCSCLSLCMKQTINCVQNPSFICMVYRLLKMTDDNKLTSLVIKASSRTRPRTSYNTYKLKVWQGPAVFCI